MVHVDPDGEFFWLAAAIFAGFSNITFNYDNVSNFGDGLKYFAAGAASSAIGAYATALTAVRGVLPGMLMGGLSGGSSNVLFGGINNVLGGGDFFDGWQRSFLSGAINGGISGGVSGYKSAIEEGADWLSGNKWTDVKTYEAQLKYGAPVDDSEAYCYARSGAYADMGHGDRPTQNFIDHGDGARGHDPTIVYRKALAGEAGVVDIYPKGEGWDNLGLHLESGSELVGVTGASTQAGHTRNITGLTVGSRQSGFGGDFKRMLKATSVWDPSVGHIKNGPTNFLRNKMTWIKYY